MSSKIIIVAYADDNLKDKGEYYKFISHGVNVDTLESITLPCERYDVFIKEYCKFDYDIHEYVLK